MCQWCVYCTLSFTHLWIFQEQNAAVQMICFYLCSIHSEFRISVAGGSRPVRFGNTLGMHLAPSYSNTACQFIVEVFTGPLGTRDPSGSGSKTSTSALDTGQVRYQQSRVIQINVLCPNGPDQTRTILNFPGCVVCLCVHLR